MNVVAEGKVVVCSVDRIAKDIIQSIGRLPAGAGVVFDRQFDVVTQPDERGIVPAVARIVGSIAATAHDVAFFPGEEFIKTRMEEALAAGISVVGVAGYGLLGGPVFVGKGQSGGECSTELVRI